MSSRSFVADVERRLPDFTEYRLAEMDATGIDIQVLSLTVPGVQADGDAATAQDHARFANDHLARVVAGHPDRFRGFAALPTQTPRPRRRNSAAASAILGHMGEFLPFMRSRLDSRYRTLDPDPRTVMDGFLASLPAASVG